MLETFFALNEPYDTFKASNELTAILRNSNGLKDVKYQPDTLKFADLDVPRRFFEGKTFTNVSFAKTEISGIIFRDCKFIDCLFMGTRFIDCRFHNCTFDGCNPHKIEFANTYIDPGVFEGMLHKVDHSNIGIHLFQQLYKNAMETEQRKFARTAEFNMQKWERYNFDHEFPRWKKFKTIRIVEWLQNVLFWVLAGYGIRPKFLGGWAIVFAVASVGGNYIWWNDLKVAGLGGPVSERTLFEVVYYTATSLGGFSGLSPGSDVGKSFFLVQAVFGFMLVSLFIRWLVRQALR